MWVTPAITASISIGVLISRSQPLLNAGPESHGSHRITTSPRAIFTQAWLTSVIRTVLVLPDTTPALCRRKMSEAYTVERPDVTVEGPGAVHIGGATPRPTLMRGVVRVPSGCLVAAAMKIAAPGLSSDFSPGR